MAATPSAVRRSVLREEVLSRERVVEFLQEKEGSVLRAWLWYFDPDLELRVTALQFSHAAREMGLGGNATATFAVLDEDKSGELAFEELHEEDARLWRLFRDWASHEFDSAKDMHTKLSQLDRRNVLGVGQLTLDVWTESLSKLGWDEGCEDELFEAFEDVRGGGKDGKRHLTPINLKWIDIEARRRKKKDMAKEKALQYKKRPGRKRMGNGQPVLDKFKQFLKKTYGTYIRAWRCALSPNDSMSLQKIPFFKACAELGWSNDVKLLWHAFGKDEIGTLCLDELDARSAVILAHFQVLVEQKLGGVANAFAALDRTSIKKVRFDDFSASLRELGFKEPVKTLFHGLDRHGNKFLVQEDLKFLERWKPPAFLTIPPSFQAQQEVKDALLHRYKYYLKAWRRSLDQEGSNRCSWGEFCAACKKLGFVGDVAGAWRAFDNDMSGYITLREIDPESNDVLVEFRRWATQQFGSVRTAFQVFDDDISDSVDIREFRRGLRIYGFEGNAVLLFRALDVEGRGDLCMAEVAFLDEWDLGEEAQEKAAARARSKCILQRATKKVGTAAIFKRLSTMETAAEPGEQRSMSKFASLLAAVRDMPDEPAAARADEGATAVAGGERTPPLTPRSRTPHPGGGGAPHIGTPRIAPFARRTWWNEVPLRYSPPDEPRGSPPLTGWCAHCQARGPCRHISPGRALDPRRQSEPLSSRPSSVQGCHSVGCHSVQTTFPTMLDGTLRSDRRLRQRHEAVQLRRLQVPPLLWPSPASLAAASARASSALGAADEEEFEFREASMWQACRGAADVQVMAISQFPMGSVSMEQVKASLREVQDKDALEKILPRAGWMSDPDRFALGTPRTPEL